jgi:hypothetical protein
MRYSRRYKYNPSAKAISEFLQTLDQEKLEKSRALYRHRAERRGLTVTEVELDAALYDGIFGDDPSPSPFEMLPEEQYELFGYWDADTVPHSILYAVDTSA